MTSIDKKLLKSVLINKHYIHNLPINVEKIPHFNQKSHYNIISLITHVLILMGIHPIKITNMGSKMPIKRSVVVRSGSKRKINDRERVIERLITEIVEPLQKRTVTEKRPRHTYKYSLFDMETERLVDLLWTHDIENTTTTPKAKIKIARRLALMLGIKRVACIDSTQDVINNNRSFMMTYAPYCFIMRKYPSPVSRKLIYANLVRLLEGVGGTLTLSDKIQ